MLVSTNKPWDDNLTGHVDYFDITAWSFIVTGVNLEYFVSSNVERCISDDCNALARIVPGGDGRTAEENVLTNASLNNICDSRQHTT